MAWKNARAGGPAAASRDHQSELTAKIIAALEAGTPPWRRPWHAGKSGGPAMPQNAVTGTRYRGVNVLTLGLSALTFGSDPRWATYKQAAERGWQVRKGERGVTAYFYKRLELREAGDAGDGEEAVRRIPLLRSFTLFHASQIDGMPDYVAPTADEAPWRTPEAVETIIAGSGAVVRTGGSKAFYAPSSDHIQMPPAHAFSSASGYSSTLLHEAGHWSGAPARLDRDLRNAFGTPDYAREELRVEIAQSMVCAEIGLETDFGNSCAYLANWLSVLKSDRREILRAASDAQRIADYLLCFHPAYAAKFARAADEPPSDASDRTVPGEQTPVAARFDLAEAA